MKYAIKSKYTEDVVLNLVKAQVAFTYIPQGETTTIAIVGE